MIALTTGSSITFLKEGSSPEESHYVYYKLFTSVIIKYIFPTTVRSKHNNDMPLDGLIVRNDNYRSNSAVKAQVYNLYPSEKWMLNTSLSA